MGQVEVETRRQGAAMMQTADQTTGQVAPGVFRFDTHPFNWYVVEEDGRLTIVDAGWPGHWPVFIEGISSLGYTLKDVEAVVLTHAHADHMGFSERLRKASGAQIWVHEIDLPRALSVNQPPPPALPLNLWRPFVRKFMKHAISNGAFHVPHIAQARTFREEQVLDVPGRPRVIHLPGHTPGESAFLLQNCSTLLSGDALATMNLMTGKVGDPQLVHRYLNQDNREAARSLAKLRGLGDITLLPGHGPAWHGDVWEAMAIASMANLAANSRR